MYQPTDDYHNDAGWIIRFIDTSRFRYSGGCLTLGIMHIHISAHSAIESNADTYKKVEIINTLTSSQVLD